MLHERSTFDIAQGIQILSLARHIQHKTFARDIQQKSFVRDIRHSLTTFECRARVGVFSVVCRKQMLTTFDCDIRN